jgi:hypothetical protein
MQRAIRVLPEQMNYLLFYDPPFLGSILWLALYVGLHLVQV